MSVIPSPTVAVTRPRLDSVDALRGLVMVLMALDHARDFFHFGAVQGIDPLDLKSTTPALFFTRWITHYCAPIFMFLAGTGAFLSARRGKSKRELSWFLLTRGAWLILLEWTFVQWAGWDWGLDWHKHYGLVLWALGWSMIALAGLIHLPMIAIATFGLAMIGLHNAFDGIKAESLGGWGSLWRVLHQGGMIPLGSGHQLAAGYPLIPWIGVMAAGYAFGAWLQGEPTTRSRRLWQVGAVVTIGFIVLRFSNFYGDSRPWTPQASVTQTLYSFLDCSKYPPSLCYLLMTLGPGILLLARWNRGLPDWLRPLLVFGRVPMFYYLLHIPLLHAMAVLAAKVRWGQAGWLYGSPADRAPAHVGFGLITTYFAWAVGVGLLYLACRWFAEVKRRRRDAWLSYL